MRKNTGRTNESNTEIMNEEQFHKKADELKEDYDDESTDNVYRELYTILNGYEPHTERDARILALVESLSERREQ